MALWAYALRTVADVKATAWVSAGAGADALIEACVNEASEMVEKAWGRHIVSRGPLTEDHPGMLLGGASAGLYSPPISGPPIPVGYGALTPSLGPELYLNEWPIVSVTTVHEDPSRVYGAGALLAAGTDYLVSKPTGKLVRLSGGMPRAWASSWRAVRVVYLGGYQNTAGSVSGADPVPPVVLRVFDELVGWMIRQRTAKEVGLSSVSDALGNRTFQGPAYITPQMQKALLEAGATPGAILGRTGERDA